MMILSAALATYLVFMLVYAAYSSWWRRRETERLSAPKKWKVWRELERNMKSDRFTEEDYIGIYGNDAEAIQKAKDSWAKAGEEVLESSRPLFFKDSGDSECKPNPKRN